jgi:hypothetical protein
MATKTVLVRGPAGPKGERGLPGVGIRGPKGDRGERGISGRTVQGPQGLPGPAGPAGSPGGEKGDKGDIGATGPRGFQGEQGEKGDIGLTGLQGVKGDTGPTIYLHAVTDGGFLGDGTTADTNRLQALLIAASTTEHKEVYIPQGVYLVAHPICVPDGVCLRGEGGHPGVLALVDGDLTAPFTGTVLVPAVDFEKAWCGDVTKYPPAVLQSANYAPAKVGSGFAWSYGDWWHGGKMIGLYIYNYYNVTNLHGVAVYSPGEQSLVQDIMVKSGSSVGFVTGFYITGYLAILTLELCSAWNCSNYVMRFERHPSTDWWNNGVSDPTQPWPATGYEFRMNHSNGGHARINGISGDGNTPGFIKDTGAHCLMIYGLKYEQGANQDSDVSVFDYDVDPTYIGTTDGANGGSRPTLDLKGTVDGGLIGMNYLIRIRHTGTDDIREWPRPVIRAHGNFGGVSNLISDETFDEGAGRVIGEDGVGDCLAGSFGNFHYCNDGNEMAIWNLWGGYRFLHGPAMFEGGVVITRTSVAGLSAYGSSFIGGIAFALDGRKQGEDANNGTGCLVYRDSTGWRRASDDTAVVA